MTRKSRRQRFLQQLAIATLFAGLAALTLLSGGCNKAAEKVARELGEAKVERARIELQELRNAADMYFVTHQEWPARLADLVAPPEGSPFLDALKQDPWGNDYRYEIGGPDIRLSSSGPDGEPGTDDDIEWELLEGPSEIRVEPTPTPAHERPHEGAQHN